MDNQPYDLDRGPLDRLYAAQQRAALAALSPVAVEPVRVPLTEGTFFFRLFLAAGAVAGFVSCVLPLCR